MAARVNDDNRNSHISFGAKLSGKPGAGKRHAGFDVAGIGNVNMGVGLRARTKVLELPPNPTVNASVLDPTCEGLEVIFLRSTHPTVKKPGTLQFLRDKKCNRILISTLMPKISIQFSNVILYTTVPIFMDFGIGLTLKELFIQKIQ